MGRHCKRGAARESAKAPENGEPAERVWPVRCQDQDGRRTQAWVGLGPDGLVVTARGADTLVFTPLQAGRLRAVLREALLTLNDLAPS